MAQVSRREQYAEVLAYMRENIEKETGVRWEMFLKSPYRHVFVTVVQGLWARKEAKQIIASLLALTSAPLLSGLVYQLIGDQLEEYLEKWTGKSKQQMMRAAFDKCVVPLFPIFRDLRGRAQNNIQDVLVKKTAFVKNPSAEKSLLISRL